MSSGPEKRRLAAGVVVVILLSAGLAVAFYFLTPAQTPQHDAESYDIIARLVAGYGLPDKTPDESFEIGLHGLFRRGFIYPAIVGFVYRALGAPDYSAVYLLQAILLPVAVLLTYLAGSTAFDRRTGMISSLLYALYLPAVWHTGFLLTETVLAVLFALMLWMLARYVNHQSPLTSCFLGLVTGLLSISHPIWVFSPAVLCVSLFFTYRRREKRWLIARKLSFVVLGLLAVLVPWHAVRIAWNLPQLGQGGTGFGAGGGFTFYVGSRAETRGQTVPEDYLVVETYFPIGRLRDLFERVQTGEVTIEPILLKIIEEKLASPDQVDWTLTDFDYYRAGIENWLDRPWQIPYLVAIKTYWFLLDVNNTPSYPMPESVLYNYSWRVFFKMLNWPTLILTLIGLAVVRRRYPDRLVLFAGLIYQTLAVLLTYPDNRYKYPGMSAMALLVAVGSLWAAGYVIRRRAQTTESAKVESD